MIGPPPIFPKASATYRSPLVSTSIGHALVLPFLPCLAPLSLMFFSMSGRLGRYIAVTARPVIGILLTVFQPPSNWFRYPSFRNTVQASSIMICLARSNRLSETFGLPSAYLSPCHAEVRKTNSSFDMVCANNKLFDETLLNRHKRIV